MCQPAQSGKDVLRNSQLQFTQFLLYARCLQDWRNESAGRAGSASKAPPRRFIITPQNVYAPAVEKADSSFDHRCRLTANALYDLPFAKAAHGWRHRGCGWLLSSWITRSSSIENPAPAKDSHLPVWGQYGSWGRGLGLG
jgi:hypothetical protein